ncbi:uncharacterized protein IAS62_003071 [Cryptococcus decagattii]|uniref:Uncharacterized protein n=1 Tax=Cryptococcus decagattii TaxID=1859122 RepID=A0ABZ2ATH1_9TREE
MVAFVISVIWTVKKRTIQRRVTKKLPNNVKGRTRTFQTWVSVLRKGPPVAMQRTSAAEAGVLCEGYFAFSGFLLPVTLQIPALQLFGKDCLGRPRFLIVMLIFVRMLLRNPSFAKVAR